MKKHAHISTWCLLVLLYSLAVSAAAEKAELPAPPGPFSLSDTAPSAEEQSGGTVVADDSDMPPPPSYPQTTALPWAEKKPQQANTRYFYVIPVPQQTGMAVVSPRPAVIGAYGQPYFLPSTPYYMMGQLPQTARQPMLTPQKADSGTQKP